MSLTTRLKHYDIPNEEFINKPVWIGNKIIGYIKGIVCRNTIFVNVMVETYEQIKFTE